ncbi:MAG: spore cortex-lytic enzyme [Oscillospiraceae bacterium]|jgi:N-acetylmuramoyl-L-alanine amidase
MQNRLSRYRLPVRTALLILINLVTLVLLIVSVQYQSPQSVDVLSKYGSRGAEVRAIQQVLKDWGLFNEDITGYYGPVTQEAVKKFQRIKGLQVDGIAGPQTLRAMGITVGTIPDATENNVYLLARIISAEARGEPYSGQVAVGACVLNRIEHPSFPDTLSGVIYQKGAFTAITDGQFDQPISDSAYRAAREALNGNDPSGGAIYYYNPDKTSNQWIRSRPVIKRIGNHLFCS